ncbi:hypothetical protein BCR42DRAFT_422109 [Absidia repens]|uniref:Uncharacterized protein n=1 Tax=Absidia repens TaxID=90262 RepID=A0A1X2I780_9FUNG|nr:hypothetical protein BCR42DRAFT_422109 [Absidia repens]
MNTNNIYPKDQERQNTSQQHQQRIFQNSNPTRPLVSDSNEYIGILNTIAEMSREVINGNDNFSSHDKELATEDMKKHIMTLAHSLGANLRLPNGEPLPIETLLKEPENKDLTNDRKEWEMKSRDALRRNIQDRKEMTNKIDDLIKKAIDFQSAEVMHGTFDDQSDNELDDLPPLDPKLQEDMKKEFTDSLDLLINIQKETPLRLEQYDKIDKILNMEKSTSSTPQNL